MPKLDLRPGVRDPVILLISRRAVESRDVDSVVKQVKPLLAAREDALLYRGQMSLVIDGYESDPRELVDIKEVRAFLAAFTEAWPYWAFFFSQADDSIMLLISCLCGSDYPGGGAVEMDSEKLKDVLLDGFNAMNDVYERFGLSEEELEVQSNGVIEMVMNSGGD